MIFKCGVAKLARWVGVAVAGQLGGAGLAIGRRTEKGQAYDTDRAGSNPAPAHFEGNKWQSN